MTKVSVVYCTARHGGFDILAKSIEHQTHPDIELIIVDELRRFLPEQLGTMPFRYVTPPPKKDRMFWNLSASLNEGVRHAKGDLIVLLQDYIYLPPDAIEKYVRKFELEGPKCLISGVSDQYALPNSLDNALGAWSVWDHDFEPPHGEIVFKDPRNKDRGGFFATIPLEWEANWGCFPRQAWLDIGGFDERYDAGWGYDNVDFADRCQHAGYRIFLDCDNPVQCYNHIGIFGEQTRRDQAPNNCALYNRLQRDRHKKMEPWKLNYA